MDGLKAVPFKEFAFFRSLLSRPGPTAPVLQRKCACGGAEECASCSREHSEGSLLRREPAGTGTAAGVPPIVHEVLQSPGRSLSPSVREFFEPRFGHDFGHVRVHAGARAAESARSVNALAYTMGANIVFRSEAFDPHSQAGKKLLAHELTHVLQQPPGLHPSHELRISRPDDPAERQASAMSESLFAPIPSPMSSPSGLVSQKSILARLAEVEPEVEEDVEKEQETNGREPGQRYSPHPRNNSLEGILEQMTMENQRKRAIFEAELPIATLARAESRRIL